ncbi:MAG: radical SAM protein, partial [Oscillospiraceae bacterium]|nr:radical SAM protein [Oscillospiraceae bacterium]
MTKRILFLIVSDNDMWRDVEELGTAYMVSQARKYGHTALMMETQAAQYDNGIIEEYKPDLVVFPIYSLNRDAVYRICTEIRGAFSDLVLCVGGAFTVYYANYANYNAEAILQGCAAVNAVIRHEGEQIIIDLLDTLNDPGAWESINGLAYRNKDGIHVNDDNGERPDLNTLPFPARDLLRQKRLPFAQISTSRGCTARCSFCAYQLMWKAWRGRNITSVLDEIQQLVERDGIHAFNFVDGSFEDPGYNAERMAALAQGILDRKLQISYYIQMRAETSRKIPDALMRLLRDSGLSSVCPGLESANEDDLKLFRKAPAPDTMTYAVDFFRRHDVNVDPGFINFNAYSTPGNLERNIG